MANCHINIRHLILSLFFNIIISFTLSSKIPDTLRWFTPDQCSVYFPSINTSFNVCNLKLPNGFGDATYYEVKDYRYSAVSNESQWGKYYYHFNIGGPVLSVDPICQNITSNPGYCTNITTTDWGTTYCDTDLTPIDGIAYAYQLRNNTETNTIDDCWRLSNQFGGPPQWSLYYAQNPTDGIKLSYLNGDFLHDGPCPVNRKFTIAFLCENEFLNVPDEEPLYETEPCDYTLEIPSIYGCPVECKTYDRSLCNGQGLCGYDFTNMKPRCFCYDKYIGDDCSIYISNETVTAPNKDLPSPSPINIINTFSKTENDKIIKITYDLTPMGLNGFAYNITDENPDRPFQYFVGIFQSIDLNKAVLPETCLNFSTQLPCTNIGHNGTHFICNSFDTQGRDYSANIYAFQYDPTDGFCGLLGTTYAWELFDDIDDPARGVTINYQGGTWCGSRGINRGFRISLICPDDAEDFTIPNINTEAYVFEDTEAYCEYSMEIQTTIACPYQCRTEKLTIKGIKEYSVCSQHGICVADPNAGFVRCLCDDGWTGIECNVIDSTRPTKSPTRDPTGKPTNKPTRYPTLGVKIHNVTVNGNGNKGQKTGGFTAIIIILTVVLLVLCMLGYYGHKRFKQKEQVLQMKLAEAYQEFGDDDDKQHDVITKKGATTFTTIDDHIAKDTEEEEED